MASPSTVRSSAIAEETSPESLDNVIAIELLATRLKLIKIFRDDEMSPLPWSCSYYTEIEGHCMVLLLRLTSLCTFREKMGTFVCKIEQKTEIEMG